jgi:hypothetical protein
MPKGSKKAAAEIHSGAPQEPIPEIEAIFDRPIPKDNVADQVEILYFQGRNLAYAIYNMSIPGANRQKALEKVKSCIDHAESAIVEAATKKSLTESVSHNINK